MRDQKSLGVCRMVLSRFSEEASGPVDPVTADLRGCERCYRIALGWKTNKLTMQSRKSAWLLLQFLCLCPQRYDLDFWCLIQSDERLGLLVPLPLSPAHDQRFSYVWKKLYKKHRKTVCIFLQPFMKTIGEGSTLTGCSKALKILIILGAFHHLTRLNPSSRK